MMVSWVGGEHGTPCAPRRMSAVSGTRQTGGRVRSGDAHDPSRTAGPGIHTRGACPAWWRGAGGVAGPAAGTTGVAGATIGLFGIAGTMSAVLLSLAGAVRSRQRVPGGSGISTGSFGRSLRGPDALAGSWPSRSMPQVFSQGALQVSLAVVLLIPLFLCADRILAQTAGDGLITGGG